MPISDLGKVFNLVLCKASASRAGWYVAQIYLFDAKHNIPFSYAGQFSMWLGKWGELYGKRNLQI